jgi:hypothetical protein
VKDAADQLRSPFALAAGSRLDLVFLGKILPLDATLQACGIKTGDTIFLVEVNFSLAAPEPASRKRSGQCVRVGVEVSGTCTYTGKPAALVEKNIRSIVRKDGCRWLAGRAGPRAAGARQGAAGRESRTKLDP